MTLHYFSRRSLPFGCLLHAPGCLLSRHFDGTRFEVFLEASATHARWVHTRMKLIAFEAPQPSSCPDFKV